ncbi:MAG: TRAP transporter substrate-binding protein DctP [Candidatus Marinimicrobia bacterium]|nr:TRAP transporter substrate-binding protein DctP [Candidatus Neomarinimicrobiota bacterium]
MNTLLRLLFCLLLVGEISAKKTIIKMATLAPEGTDWHGMLVEMGQRWKEATDGQIVLRIYPGGVVGDERDMIRKMRIGQIHAAAISSEGLSEVNPDVNGFVLPLIFDDYDDVDWLREKLSTQLEEDMRENGFEVLLWADVGWAKWFTTDPIVYLDDLKGMKIFTWAGDYRTQNLWESAGFQSVPLASIDVLSGFQTGLINAIATTPLYALSQQWFGSANYMLDINWGLLTAGVIIDKKIWNRISPEHQVKMKSIAQDIGLMHQRSTRHQDDEAIKVMQEYGLKIHQPTPDEIDHWKNYLKTWYPKLRGKYVSEEIFDTVIEFMAEKDSLDALHKTLE